jgi:hypothetical protein
VQPDGDKPITVIPIVEQAFGLAYLLNFATGPSKCEGNKLALIGLIYHEVET